MHLDLRAHLMFPCTSLVTARIQLAKYYTGKISDCCLRCQGDPRIFGLATTLAIRARMYLRCYSRAEKNFLSGCFLGSCAIGFVL